MLYTKINIDIFEQDKLLLFIAFVIPGFISLKTYELFFPSQNTKSSKQLIEAITYSCINYALLFWLIIPVETNNVYSVIFVLFIAPILWIFLWKTMRKTNLLQKYIPHPTQQPWDYVFSQREPFWVIVTLKDGTKIAGSYDSKSFSSNSPAAEQLYLAEVWILNDDGGFERPRKSTKGIIILSSEMTCVELFNKQWEN